MEGRVAGDRWRVTHWGGDLGPFFGDHHTLGREVHDVFGDRGDVFVPGWEPRAAVSVGVGDWAIGA